MSIEKKIRRKTIGRVDKADFPVFDLNDIDVKIDTGAYTGVIHCHNIKEKKKKGKNIIQFNLLDPEHEEYNEKELYSKEYELKTIKSSNGQEEQRYIVETEIVLFGKSYSISLSLTDRSDMKYPILIGRSFLADQFLVDVSKTDLSFKRKEKLKSKKVKLKSK